MTETRRCGCVVGVVRKTIKHCGGHGIPPAKVVEDQLREAYEAVMGAWHSEECYRSVAYNGRGCTCGLNRTIMVLMDLLSINRAHVGELRTEPETERTMKIYCFLTGADRYGVGVVALSEDGQELATHFSSSRGWAQHDIGITSERKHDIYAEAFPDGYELVWVDQPKSNPGCANAVALAATRDGHSRQNGEFRPRIGEAGD